MTLQTETNKIIYNGLIGQTIFAYTFRVDNKADMEVYLAGELIADNLWTIDGLGDDNGGNVTLNDALTADQTVTLLRDVPETQEVDYQPFDAFPSETHEAALDKLTMMVQQMQEQVSRSPQLPVDSTLEDYNLGTPVAEKIIQYRADETGQEASEFTIDELIDAAGGDTPSATPPANPNVGDGWWDIEDGKPFIWYDDGDSIQWVERVPGGGGGSGGDNISDDVIDTPIPGAGWWSSLTGRPYIWYEDGDSGQWVERVPSANGESMFDAKLDGFLTSGDHHQILTDIDLIAQDSTYFVTSSSLGTLPSDFSSNGFLVTELRPAGNNRLQILYGRATETGKVWMRNFGSSVWDAWVSVVEPNQSPFVAYALINSDGSSISGDNGLLTSVSGGTGIMDVSFINPQADANYNIQVMARTATPTIVSASGASGTGFDLYTATNDGTLVARTVFVLLTRTDIPFV